MTVLGRLVLPLLMALPLVLAAASPTPARVAAIETAAPLADHSEQSIRRAIEEAVRTALRGAVAMGLPWVELRQADVREDQVVIQLLATDAEPDEDDLRGGPSPADTPWAPGQSPRLDL